MLQSDLMARCSADELTHWLAFLGMHTDESWHQAATIASAAMSAFGKGPPPSAFLPRRRKATRPQSFGEMEAAFFAFCPGASRG